jgi:hypothetical protein
MTVAGTDDIAITSLDEGNGIGYVIAGRNAANYGNVGLGAVDLSASNSTSSTKGATGANSTVSGGLNNTAGNIGVTIGGGESNNATSTYDTIGGGNLNTITGSNSTIGGGQSNTINAGNATIGGGNGNNISSGYGVIGGGVNNTLTAQLAVIIGGSTNNANGDGSITGGYAMTAASFCEISLGTYGTNYTAGSTSAIVGTDRIFNIGNGANGGARSNAFTILKNGLATLPSVTNELIIAEATGKAVVTKEFVSNVMRNIVKDVVPSSAVTGTLTETILKSYLITANTFASSDNLSIPNFGISKVGVANTVTIKIYINTSNSLSGATQIATYNSSASNTYAKILRSYALDGGNLKGLPFTTSALSDINVSGGGLASASFNPAVANYIITTATLTDITDSVTQTSFIITN